MDLNDMDPVLLVAALTQQIAEQEKRAAACSGDAENKAALSKNLLRRGNLLIQMGEENIADKCSFEMIRMLIKICQFRAFSDKNLLKNC